MTHTDEALTANSTAQVEIRAKIIRVNGTVEDLDIVTANYKNIYKEIYWKLIGHPLSVRRIKRSNQTIGN